MTTTNETATINERIHKWLGRGDCVHEFPTPSPNPQLYASWCSRCLYYIHPANTYDYTNDLNAVAEAEAKAVEEFGREQYVYALDCIVNEAEEVKGAYVWSSGELINFATATAEQRSKAILSLIDKETR